MNAPASWVSEDREGVVVHVLVKPRASRSRVVGVQGEELAVQLAAPPVDGAANEALRELLADVAGIPRRSVVLLAGETSRHKRVRLCGVTLAAARQSLLPADP